MRTGNVTCMKFIINRYEQNNYAPMLFRVLENLKQRDGIITMSQEIKSDSKLAGRADILNKWSGTFPQQR